MGVGAGLYMYDFVVKSSLLLSHLLMSFLYLQLCTATISVCITASKFTKHVAEPDGSIIGSQHVRSARLPHVLCVFVTLSGQTVM